MDQRSSWPRLAAWLLALAGGIVLAAPRGAGPGTAACRSALDALQRLEAEAIGARDAAPAAAATAPAAAATAPQRLLDQVRALRREAAKACVGGSGDAPPPTASTQPPLSITPSRADERMPAAPRPATVPVPAVTIPRPAAPLDKMAS